MAGQGRQQAHAGREPLVLTHTYEDVDYVSCHAYYEEKNGDLTSFLASAVDMDGFIESAVATADHVKAVSGSDKTLNIPSTNGTSGTSTGISRSTSRRDRQLAGRTPPSRRCLFCGRRGCLRQSAHLTTQARRSRHQRLPSSRRS